MSRCKTIKLLEENVGQKLQNTGFSTDFLDVTPKVQAKKKKRQIEFHDNYPQSKKANHRTEENT